MGYQLRNHIPLAGPATREPCDGSESRLRVSMGFTPRWYHDRLGIDFDQKWHLDPEYRYASMVNMKELLHAKFPTIPYFTPRYTNGIEPTCATISSVYGILLIPMLYGAQPLYTVDGWPDAKPIFSFQDLKELPEIDLESSTVFQQLLSQMDFIANRWGAIHGYLNYQGILNIAVKLRGSELFIDMLEEPETIKNFFSHISRTIEMVSKNVQKKQRASGFSVDLLSMSNCTVSMISSSQYEEFILPFDSYLASQYPRFGIHTCNWVADRYLDAMRKIDKMGYLDTGTNSDLVRIKRMFPDTRRAILITPGELESMDEAEILAMVTKIDLQYAPCDIVLADLETTIADERILHILELIANVEDGRQ